MRAPSAARADVPPVFRPLACAVAGLAPTAVPGATRLLEKPASGLTRRDHAGVPLAKPLVSLLGNQSVQPVPQWTGNDIQHRQDPPQAAEVLCDPQRRITLGVAAVPFDQHHALGRIRTQAARFQQPPTGIGLQRSEPEMSLRIVANDEPDGPVAKVAYAVEEDDGAIRHWSPCLPTEC